MQRDNKTSLTRGSNLELFDLQMTSAVGKSNILSQTVPYMPPMAISTRPTLGDGPPTRRTSVMLTGGSETYNNTLYL